MVVDLNQGAGPKSALSSLAQMSKSRHATDDSYQRVLRLTLMAIFVPHRRNVGVGPHE
jgi:hypothetical protein